MIYVIFLFIKQTNQMCLTFTPLENEGVKGLIPLPTFLSFL